LDPDAGVASFPHVDMQLSALDLSDSRATQHVVDFLDEQTRTHPFQYPGWGTAMMGSGSDMKVVVGRQRNQIRFVATTTRFLLSRHPPIRGVECRYGPIAADEESLVAGLRGFGRWWKDRPTHVDVHPNISVEEGDRIAVELASEGWRLASVAGTGSSLIVQLGEDDELLASFRKTTRHEVLRARKAGVSVRAGTDAVTFAELHREMATRKGIPQQPPELFPALAGWFTREPDRGTILIATDLAGEPIGGVAILRAGMCTWYCWGATRRVEGANAGHILQFEAMRWAREHGCTRYDLGGYEPGGPVATFKAGFSTNLVRSAPGLRRTAKGPRWLMYYATRAIRGTRTS
jgi:CelD/BcsL family acetyltransferase involved in cellulose biosynthesis